MLTYFVKRLLMMIPVALAVVLVVFFILRLTPGDPAALLAGERATPETIERIRTHWGFDRPLYVQYFLYMGRLLRGDLGISTSRRRPVASLIKTSLPITLELGIAGFLVSILIGIPTGIVAATKHGTFIDQASLFGALTGVSIPEFWFGILLIYFLGINYRLFPISGYGTLNHLIMPAIALGFRQAALIARITRSSLLEVLSLDYINTARAKGLSERVVIFKHALKNSLLPVVTMLGLRLGYMLAGTIVLEMVFGRPGMGRLLVEGLLSRDYAVVQGMLVILALGIMFANMVADLFYSVLDPRIKYQ